MKETDPRLFILLVALGLIVGFSLGVVCQGRASEAGAITIDPRISGGSPLQQAAADWVLLTRSDFSAVVRSVTFVPRNRLLVNAATAEPHIKERCWKDNEGRSLTTPRCVGEAEWPGGHVRIAQDYQPNDVQQLLHSIAHEYAHILLSVNCGLCTTDEALADQCADDPTKCRRYP